MSGRLKTVSLAAFDTLFFRESRPFESIGGSELAGVFPPPPRTVLGSIRTAIGEALGVDWREFRQGGERSAAARELIGHGDDLGALALNGVWLSDDTGAGRERLYPVPLFLLEKGEYETVEFERLEIGAAVQTHLGRVRLPALPKGKMGYRPLENAWITRRGLEELLAGERSPPLHALTRKAQLFQSESRLGIARDNRTGTVEKGLLYQSSHLRPKAALQIEADIAGLPDDVLRQCVVRLGAEGRMAGLSLVPTPELPAPPMPDACTQGLIVILLTPARFGPHHQGTEAPSCRAGWLPPDFTETEEQGVTVWKGEIEGIGLTLHGAVIGKPLREGGWDMAAHRPRPVQSLIPAGSSFYCTVQDDDIVGAIRALHGKGIGHETNLGRGRIVCGLWKKQECKNEETRP